MEIEENKTPLKTRLQRGSLLRRKGAEKEKERRDNVLEIYNLKENIGDRTKAESYFDVI
jgi:hypothetical protein